MIHQYKLNGYNIVLDVYSGSVHLVDDVAYDMIALYETTPGEEIIRQMLERYGDREDVTEQDLRDCLEDIETLKAQGKLFSEDAFKGFHSKLHNPDNPSVKALCLHMAHTCNLDCNYCFARQGRYHGDIKEALMPFEVGKQALDFLMDHSGKRRNLEVDFFGGEPLLDFKVIKELVAYGRSKEAERHKKFRFTLTTNGILLDDEVIDFCNREMHNVILSLDGRKEVNDHYRKSITGKGSYDIIVPKFQKFLAKRGTKNYYMRGTYTHENVEFTKDVYHMADLGFKELSMEPAVSSPDEPWALTEEDLPVLYQQYEELAKEMMRRDKKGEGFNFYHYMIDLQSGPCLHKRFAGCGSGTEYLAVTPWGELFPCHQFVNDPEWSLGNVYDGIIHPELVKKFACHNISTNPACADCWAKLYCSGGCTANAYHMDGDINGVHEYGCKLFRKRMECAIMMQADHMEHPEEYPGAMNTPGTTYRMTHC